MHPVLAELSPYLAGGFATYRDTFLVEGGSDRWTAGSALLDRAVLAERLHAFGAGYAQPDVRAVATQWSKHHFARLLIPAFAANLILGRDLPVDLDAVAVAAGPDGRTLRFLTASTSNLAVGDGISRFDHILDGHLRPLVAALSQASRLSPRVLWANAGNLIETVVRQVERIPGLDPQGLSAARQLLAERLGTDGRPNALALPIRYLGEPPRRVRRVCCLRYLIPQFTLCGTCPLEAHPT